MSSGRVTVSVIFVYTSLRSTSFADVALLDDEEQPAAINVKQVIIPASNILFFMIYFFLEVNTKS